MAKQKITSRPMSLLLLWAGRLFDRAPMRPLNFVVRLIYLYLITPLAKVRLGRQVRLVLVARHSAKTGRNFNPFFSDLDFSAVFDLPPSLDELASLRTSYRRLQDISPIFGELEIFTTEEHVRFLAIQKKHEDFFRLIRDIRKTSWLLEDAAAGSGYQSYKTARAIQNLKGIYGVAKTASIEVFLKTLGARLARVLDAIVVMAPADLPESTLPVSNHLRWRPETDLGLDKKRAWVLMAILPSETALSESIENLRKDAGLCVLHADYAAAESIQIEAVYRARSAEYPWMKEWAENLRQQSLGGVKGCDL